MCKYVNKCYLGLRTPAQSSANKVWYLLHHCVFHPKKPNKLRIVFDCAAHFKGVSLNDAILSGPDLTETLSHVLLRCPTHPISGIGVIEEIFCRFMFRRLREAL